MASDVLKVARLQANTELTSQLISLVADPLWSTILGFVAIHELRKRDMIGPVADDVLYAGVIAINTARQPALMELAGKGMSAAAGAAGAAAGAAGAVGAAYAGQKLLARGKGPASLTQALTWAAKGGKPLTVLPPGAMPGDVSPDNYAAAVREGKWWQIWRAKS
jgi:hypothetical protein